MGSMEYYVKDEQARAKRENAPATAIFRDTGQLPKWHTLEGITSSGTQRRIISWSHEHNVPIPQSVVDEWYSQERSI
jgi:hypothetical protein